MRLVSWCQVPLNQSHWGTHPFGNLFPLSQTKSMMVFISLIKYIERGTSFDVLCQALDKFTFCQHLPSTDRLLWNIRIKWLSARVTYTARLLRPAMCYPITLLLRWYLHWSNHAASLKQLQCYLGVLTQVLQQSSCVGTPWYQQSYLEEQRGYFSVGTSAVTL